MVTRSGLTSHVYKILISLGLRAKRLYCYLWPILVEASDKGTIGAGDSSCARGEVSLRRKSRDTTRVQQLSFTRFGLDQQIIEGKYGKNGNKGEKMGCSRKIQNKCPGRKGIGSERKLDVVQLQQA